MKPNPS